MNELFPLIDFFKTIPGAISVTEAIALYKIIQHNLLTDYGEDEIFIDFGSYMGKSSLIAASALAAINKTGSLIMVEPAYDPNGPYRKTGPYFAPDDYLKTVEETVYAFQSFTLKKPIKLILKGLTSDLAIKEMGPLPVSYAFIDTGEHNEESLKPEIDYLKSNVIKGGLIVFHDYKNQYIAPAEAAAKLVKSGDFEMIDIDWEPIISFVIENDLEKGNDSWHHPNNPCPNFIGAVRRL